jgi:alpha,alpha-trehalase
VWTRLRDRAWLEAAYPKLKLEHAFWMAMRATGGGLNHYGNHADPKGVADFYTVIHKRFKRIPEDPRARLAFCAHAMAEAESGWDFCPRFDRRCADFAPVDLNSLLYLHERICGDIADVLGNGEGDAWRRAADERQRRFSEVCWDDGAGMFFDWDLPNRRRSLVVSAANFYALWSRIATKEQADRVVASLPLLEREHGIVACKQGDRAEVYQWDHPNGWPPLHYAAIQGLITYGYAAEAERVARKYVDTVARNFQATGQLWEKYNVVSGGVDVSDEYPMPPMLGWTAGVFLYAAEVVELAEKKTGLWRRK